MMREKNFWPLGIFLVTMTVVGMIIWTVNLALKNPVELDNSYMSYYQQVDSNINEIQQEQKRFWGLYAIKPFSSKVEMNLPQGVSIELLKRETQEGVEGAKVTFRLTRPHTAREDIDLGEGREVGKGVYATPAIQFPKEGRWKLQAMIETSEGKGYFEKELNAR
ncbi:hypothetical protein WS0185 [Wolinella succinogenes]|uniref:Nitrogen fixation protein FixH n=2 Tax=Wolinella succinogenes TaxID=844 RepID=Q7MSR9_WOLSU|nr:hypothetical protein WS0185 [Wolinella succinogenes]